MCGSDKPPPVMSPSGSGALWATGLEKQSTGLTLHSYNTVGLIIDSLKTNNQNQPFQNKVPTLHTMQLFFHIVLPRTCEVTL